MDAFERNFLPAGTRGEILGSALSHLANKGLYEFTLAQVAREAQVSRPKLAYHYTDKDDLLLDLVQSWGRSGQTVTSHVLQQNLGASPADLILKISEATFLWKEQCPHFARLTPVINQLAMHKPVFAEIQKQITDTGLMRIQGLLDKLELAKRTNKPQLAQRIHFIMIGGFLYHIATPTSSAKAISEMTGVSIRALIEEMTKR